MLLVCWLRARPVPPTIGAPPRKALSAFASAARRRASALKFAGHAGTRNVRPPSRHLLNRPDCFQHGHDGAPHLLGDRTLVAVARSTDEALIFIHTDLEAVAD